MSSDKQLTRLPTFLDLTKAATSPAMANALGDASSNIVTTTAPAGGVPFWGDYPKMWDTVRIDGRTVPGLCKVKGKAARRHEKKNVSGKHGSSFTFTGDEPTAVTVHVTLWTAEQLFEYSQLISFLKTLKPVTETVITTPSKNSNTPQAGGFSTASGGTGGASYQGDLKQAVTATPTSTKKVVKVFPVNMTHPTMAIFGISQVLVVAFTFPEEKGNAGSGVYEATIECIEYLDEPMRNNGGVTAPQTAAPSISSLGSGAIGKGPTSPAKSNAGPGF